MFLLLVGRGLNTLAPGPFEIRQGPVGRVIVVRVREGEDVCAGCIHSVVVIKFVRAVLKAVCLGAVGSVCGEGQHGVIANGRHLPDPNAFAPFLLVDVMMLS